MGYATEFIGEIQIDKPLDQSTKEIIVGLNKTRRMKRNVSELAKIWSLTLSEAQEKWGEEGEFYVAESFNVTDHSVKYDTLYKETNPTIDDYNTPPSMQPSLWCGCRMDGLSDY